MNGASDPAWVTLHWRGLRWSVDLAWLEVVGEPSLDAWLASGRARVVKQTPHRSVYQVVLPGCDFHVKHYRADRRERWRCLLRGSKARGEAAVTREVARRGVPTLEVLGFGEGEWWGASDSYLITRTLPDALPLADLLQKLADQPAMRQRLAEAVGELLAAKHRAGVRHDDLHVGNLLVRSGPGGAIDLYLIDLHGAHLGGPLASPAARANLAVLGRLFLTHASRTDRLRALAAYCHARPELDLDLSREARQLGAETRTSFIRFCDYLDGRVGGANRHYRQLRAGAMRGAAVSDLGAEAIAPLLDRPDEPFDRPGARVLKRSASSAVVEIDLCVGGVTRPVILKRFDATSWNDPLRGLFREPPASWSFRMGHALRGRSLPTPRPLAVWHRYRSGLPGDGYLLVDKVPDAVTLARFVDGVPERGRLRRVIDECARLVRQLHERGLSHRDLKAANLLVSPAGWSLGFRGLCESGPDERGDRVWFIDLVGVRRHARVTRARRVQTLARLHVSFLGHPGLTRADRLRFLRTYLNWALRGRDGWKGWWRQIDAAARAKVRRNRRLGRVVG